MMWLNSKIVGLVFLAAGTARATELNSSILIFSDADLARCPAQVERAAALGNSTLSFVPSFYFSRVGQSDDIATFCQATANGKCVPLTPEYLTQLRVNYAACFRRTLELGLRIEVMPHVDDALERYWRNSLFFDPRVNYGGYSYVGTFIETLVLALQDAARSVPQLPPAPYIHLALAGEMGTSVFTYAEAYRRTLAELRPRLPQALLGVSFNHDVIGGGGRYYEAPQLAQVQRLLDDCDYVGISAYTPIDPTELSPRAFAANIKNFKEELGRDYALHLPRDMDLHFSESGLGGGSSRNDGSRAAMSAAEAGLHPYSGVHAPYAPSIDPWQNQALYDFRREFFQTYLRYLREGADGEAPPSAAFLWNVASWDVQGLYRGFEKYGDAEIKMLISAHNGY